DDLVTGVQTCALPIYSMRVAVILAFLLPVSLSAESRLGATDNVAAIRSHRSGVDVRWENKIGRALSELAILSVAREHDQPYEWRSEERRVGKGCTTRG